MSRRIAAVTTSRADFTHLYWPLRELEAEAGVDLRLIVAGAHLSAEFGTTVDEIEGLGLQVHERVECLLSSDTDIGMAKTIGVAVLGLAEVLARLRPDLLLLIADRYEMLAPATVALALRIPIAHIEGGEVSEGAVDDAVRNALTMMSHLHLTPSAAAEARVLAMGEERWRVHRTGAPSLDHLRRTTLLEKGEVGRRLGVDLERPTVLVAYHPVTLAADTLREADAVFSAVERLPHQILFSFPNSDAGSRRLIERARRLAENRSDVRVFANLGATLYWSLLRCVSLLLGNSSSGIMETPSLALPSVNVGIRQRGRERSPNIIDVEPDPAAIVAAVNRCLDPGFRGSLGAITNPYGDGRAAERIRDVLLESPLGEKLLIKRARALQPQRPEPMRGP